MTTPKNGRDEKTRRSFRICCEWRLTTTERKRILLNNIYVVDIDPQAVEVTKLSLLLKVLEDESSETLDKQLSLIHERALPDLGNNIKCGNSLIGPDFYDNQQTDMFDEEEIYRINAFDWKAEFREIMKSGGFDAVIGNPPYGAQFNDTEKEYFLQKFKHQDYQFDSYMLFIEKGIELLCENAMWGMIIPNPWLTNVLQRKLRSLVFEHRVENIRHFKKRVFPKVTVDVEILVIRKNKTPNKSLCIEIIAKDEGVTKRYHNQSSWIRNTGDPVNIFIHSQALSLFHKIKRVSHELREFCKVTVGIKPYQMGKGRPPQTRKTVSSRIFDAELQRDKTYRRYLYGKDISRYVISPVKERWISYGPWLAEPRPAANFDAPVKILVRQTGDRPIAALDTNKYLCLNNLHVVEGESRLDLHYILGLINSRLNLFYYFCQNPEKGEALAEVKKTFVERFPVFPIDLSKKCEKLFHDRIVILVDQIINLHSKIRHAKAPNEKTTLQRQIEITDKQIDCLVYELCDLNEEEIVLVEEATRK